MSRGTNAIFKDATVRGKGRSKSRHERDLLSTHGGKPLIVLANRMKADFVRHYGIPADQVFLIHSGVDSERYRPENIPLYRDEIRKRHGLGSEPVLLLVGGDWERKGVAEAITSLSMLNSLDVMNITGTRTWSADDIPGNPWIVSALWLGQYEISRARTTKELEKVLPTFEWVCARALHSGTLAEQFHPLTGAHLSVSPLTWSHATVVAAVPEYLEKYDVVAVQDYLDGNR